MGSLDLTMPRTPAHSPFRIPLAKAPDTVCSCIGLFSLLEVLCLNWVLGLLLVRDTSSGIARSHDAAYSCIGLFSLLEVLCLNWVLGLLLVWDTSSGIARSHDAAYSRSLAVPDSARESTGHRVLVHLGAPRSDNTE